MLGEDTSLGSVTNTLNGLGVPWGARLAASGRPQTRLREPWTDPGTPRTARPTAAYRGLPRPTTAPHAFRAGRGLPAPAALPDPPPARPGPARHPRAPRSLPGPTSPHTCMESALTISPPRRSPSCTASADFPVPVAPRITTSGRGGETRPKHNAAAMTRPGPAVAMETGGRGGGGTGPETPAEGLGGRPRAPAPPRAAAPAVPHCVPGSRLLLARVRALIPAALWVPVLVSLPDPFGLPREVWNCAPERPGGVGGGRTGWEVCRCHGNRAEEPRLLPRQQRGARCRGNCGGLLRKAEADSSPWQRGRWRAEAVAVATERS